MKKRIISVLLLLVLIIMCAKERSISAESVVYNSNIHAQKKIALTFDDGPHPKHTPEILEILNRYSVKSTFFVVGVNVKNYPEQLKMIFENGHEIGNHTYSHNIVKSMPKSKIEKEIIDTQTQVNKIQSYDIRLLRPPCGLYDEAFEQIARENDSKIVLWSLDTLDWAHTSTKQMAKNVLKNVKDGDIILFHDYVSGEYNTPEALEILIPILLEKGYEFVTVSELLQ